jgi:outer membrane protein OmpA-like peptidoglycan-associated protein
MMNLGSRCSWSIKISIVLVATLLLTSVAAALPRECGPNQYWNPAQGSCVKKPQRKVSADDEMRKAIEIIEGKVANVAAAEGIKRLDKLCAAKHAESCEILGFLYAGGRGVESDDSKAATLYDKACGLGLLQSCVNAADLALRMNLPNVARQKFADACPPSAANRSGVACSRAAKMAAGGAGGKSDRAEADKLFARAHESLKRDCPSDGIACYELGTLYWKGNGVAADAKLAYQSWRQGCDAGSGDSCFLQAVALHEGVGVSKDASSAMTFFDRACDKYDNARACAEQASQYVIASQLPKAVARAERACDLDGAECFLWATMFADGNGVEKNAERAGKLFARSCSQGNASACEKAAEFSLGGTASKPSSNNTSSMADRDSDGIADINDNCPDEKGSANNLGCKTKQLVKMSDGQIEILSEVFFKPGGSAVDDKSFDLLDNLAKVILAHPDLRLEVQSHSDNKGSENANLQLTNRRANAIVDYLKSKGVSASSLAGKGYGSTKPVADNSTPDGRTSNRRIIIKVIGKP